MTVPSDTGESSPHSTPQGREGSAHDRAGVLMVASELAPFAKVGGLADVIPALSRALDASGHTVRALLPYYRREPGLERLPGRDGGTVAYDLPLNPPRRVTVRVCRDVEGLDALLLLDDRELFDRPGIYGDPSSGTDWPDHAERCAVLSATAAAIASTPSEEFEPDVVHCHDHQAGFVPVFLRHGPLGLRPRRPVAVVYTIHNLGYQGHSDGSLLGRLVIDPALMRPMGPLEFNGKMNPMKAGIMLSDRLTTVSPTYAEEIRTKELGNGLEGLLDERREVMTGVLNGVDTTVWNPADDPLIPHPFSSEDLAGKTRNRKELFRTLGLRAPGPNTVLFGVVSRLARQKGLDLLLETLEKVMGMDVRLAVLGSGEEPIARGFIEGAERHPGRLAVRIGFDEGLAHLIEAGSDAFLMPSRYEPCGLNQMYSLLYGTLPVVRATGGLADTVVDYDEDPDQANGFVFRLPIPVELLKTVRRAVRAFRDRKTWRAMMLRGMTTDFSWNHAARRYTEIYRAAEEAARMAFSRREA